MMFKMFCVIYMYIWSSGKHAVKKEYNPVQLLIRDGIIDLESSLNSTNNTYNI